MRSSNHSSPITRNVGSYGEKEGPVGEATLDNNRRRSSEMHSTTPSSISTATSKKGDVSMKPAAASSSTSKARSGGRKVRTSSQPVASSLNDKEDVDDLQEAKITPVADTQPVPGTATFMTTDDRVSRKMRPVNDRPRRTAGVTTVAAGDNHDSTPQPGTATFMKTDADNRVNRKVMRSTRGGPPVDSSDTTPGTASFVRADERINRKTRSSTNTSASMRPTDQDDPSEEPSAGRVVPGTMTAVSATSVSSRVQRKMGAASQPRMTTMTTTSATDKDAKLQQKLRTSTTTPLSSRKMPPVVIDEPCEPGTVTSVTPNSKNDRVARKLASNKNGTATVGGNHNRLDRKHGKAHQKIGAVAARGSDPAAAKNSWISDEVFQGDDGEVDPELYYLRRERERQEKDDEKKAEMIALKETETKDGVEKSEQPSRPGAYVVKGAAAWFSRGGRGARKKKAKSLKLMRTKSGLNDVVVDAEITTAVNMDEEKNLTWWEAVDKSALAVGLCIVTIVLIAVTVPTVLVTTRGPSPTPAPNSSRIPLYEDFQKVFIDVSGREAFDDAESPQSKALDFIVLEDPLQLPLDSPTLVQRYILMILFFGNGGARWPVQDGKWGSGTPECEWDYIRCGDDTESATGIVTAIDLFRVGMTGTLPIELAELQSVEQLDVAENQLEPSPIPTFLYSMTTLSLLYLEANKFTGTIAEAIGQLTNMEFLGLADTELTGSLPAALGSLSNMRNFLAYRTKLSGPLLQMALNWPQLENLDAVQCRFQGTIPIELGGLGRLRNILLSDNNMEGTLPTELGNLQDMRRFAISRNSKINGTIPTELGRWDGLQELLLDSARLVGNIPTELGAFTDVVRISLSQNRFGGEIPTELGSCTSLKELSLTLNDISGTVPDSLGNLLQLTSMTLHRNDLSGSMPGSVCALRTLQLRELVVDCLGTFPEVQCPFPECCTQCS